MKTLAQWINERNQAGEDPKRQEKSLPIKQQTVSGVEYIHSQKLIHRDLKVTLNSEHIYFSLLHMNHGIGYLFVFTAVHGLQ